MTIIYTNTARHDLREIYEYIAYTLLEDHARGPFVGEPARAQSAVSG